MIDLSVIRRDGVVEEVKARDGMTLLEAIRGSGNEELQALCGGTCSCATCHIFVDEAWIDRTGHAKGDEKDLLEGSEYLSPNSRLACQVKLRANLSGIRVTIATQD